MIFPILAILLVMPYLAYAQGADTLGAVTPMPKQVNPEFDFKKFRALYENPDNKELRALTADSGRVVDARREYFKNRPADVPAKLLMPQQGMTLEQLQALEEQNRRLNEWEAAAPAQGYGMGVGSRAAIAKSWQKHFGEAE